MSATPAVVVETHRARRDSDAASAARRSVATGTSQAELIRAAIRQAVARRPERRFRSLGMGEGDGTAQPRWSSSDLYDRALGKR